MGDIGQMFSDKSKKFKNIRSTILLQEVMEKIKAKGYFVNNIDINIITQTPKIKKYKNKMIDSIAKLCEISKNQINIKGKTTEKLGVVGKEKAIACEVITYENVSKRKKTIEEVKMHPALKKLQTALKKFHKGSELDDLVPEYGAKIVDGKKVYHIEYKKGKKEGEKVE